MSALRLARLRLWRSRRGLGDLDAELEQLAMDLGGAPQRILKTHSSGQVAHLFADHEVFSTHRERKNWQEREVPRCQLWRSLCPGNKTGAPTFSKIDDYSNDYANTE